MKYTKKENADYKALNVHLKVLEERAKQLRADIRRRKAKGMYNASDPKRILRKIKSAKRQVADAGFI